MITESRNGATNEPTPASRPASTAGVSPSVILVREWEQQMSSSGCCGRIEGDFLAGGSSEEEDRDPIFARRREAMERVGVLYRGLRARYGDDLDLRIVDPRNLLSLIPLLLREGRRHGVPLTERLRELLRISVNMVIVNGRIVARGRWPDASEIVERAEADGPADQPSPSSGITIHSTR